MLRRRDLSLSMQPDGTMEWLKSNVEARLLFGRDSLQAYKIQAGIIVPAQKADWRLGVSPLSVSLKARIFENVECTQLIGFPQGEFHGMFRAVRVKNTGGSAVRLRLITLHDPTSANFRDDSFLWGSVGVNAFNRGSHVAMDEVAVPPSARVVGSRPAPRTIFMTTDRAKVADLLQVGELPESVAGTSGQIIILLQHDFDLQAQESKEVITCSVYDSEKLEGALTAFGRIGSPPEGLNVPSYQPSCSNRDLSSALSWARASAEAAESESDPLEMAECIEGLAFFGPLRAARIIGKLKERLGRDGLLSRSSGGSGYLESSIFLSAASRYLLLRGEKKISRQLYPALRRTASRILEDCKDHRHTKGGSQPSGWRRHLGKGFPSGELAEVDLAIVAGLFEFSRLAASLARGVESARFREGSEVMLSSLRNSLLDEKGVLGLNVDENGMVHKDATVDQAVGCYRHPLDRNTCSSIVHRLLEKDFETGYGPRTLPTSNRVLFNNSYGNGQLGGYWTRASLAHASLAYQAGFAGIGSLGVLKVARLIAEDAVSLGGWPGLIPYWVDLAKREFGGEGSDPVAAARLIETIVKGDLGLGFEGESPQISPPPSSTVRWVLLANVWLGEDASVFVGRGGGRAITLAKSSRVAVREGQRFKSFERLEPAEQGVAAALFYGPGQYLCVASSLARPTHVTLGFQPKDSDLLKHLSASLEEFEPGTGNWKRTQSIRVMPKISLDVSLEASDWKVFRFSTA